MDLCAYPRPAASSRTSTSSGCAPASRSAKAELRALPARPAARLGQPANGSCDGDLELPRINYGRCNERPYRYVWGAVLRAQRLPGAASRRSTPQRRTTAFFAEPGLYPGEPVFVAPPRAQDEDDGVLLSVVLDAERRPARCCSCSTRPTCTSWPGPQLPHHIPFGFHGQFAARRDRPSARRRASRSRGDGRWPRPSRERVAAADLIQGRALGRRAPRRVRRPRRAARARAGCRGSCRPAG